MDRATVWKKLHDHASRLRVVHLRDLLADSSRNDALFLQADDLTVDVTREKLDLPVLALLLDLASACGLPERRAALFAGEPVNHTEGRAALHMALRGGAPAPAGSDVESERERFLAFAERVRTGPWTDVINIGIGGSHLGPAMAARALAPDCDGPALHFVSNADGADFSDTVNGLNPASTLVIISSKTFTTAETMANARLARAWLQESAATNLVAVSSNTPACEKFGIPQDRVFGFWDWVGGRYSIWSAIGLSLAIGIGAARYRSFLEGAAAMDRHFLETPLAENLPVLLGLITVWRRNFMGCTSIALVPYDQRLRYLPAYLQQLSMESNGKSVQASGDPADTLTMPVVWGEPGTNAQHSFFQLLHQGSDIIPVDFVASASPRDADADSHRMLLSNCIAQMEALARGRSRSEVEAAMQAAGADDHLIRQLAPHRTFPGDRPSTLILHRRLTPYALGRLVSLLEHRTFVEAVIWGINPFDQWGVELGKELAASTMQLLSGEATMEPPEHLATLVARISDLSK